MVDILRCEDRKFMKSKWQAGQGDPQMSSIPLLIYETLLIVYVNLFDPVYNLSYTQMVWAFEKVTFEHMECSQMRFGYYCMPLFTSFHHK